MAENTTEQVSAEDIQAAFAELAQLNAQRAATYGMLARLYRKEISEDFLAELRSMRFPAKTGNDDTDKGYRLMATYLSNLWANSLEDLSVDFSRIFIGHGVDGYSAAYPYESVYTSPKRLMMQDARDEVLAIYRSYGLDKQESWKDSEDHIALEMEFLQTLADRTVDALNKGDEDEAVALLETQHNFMYDHLAAWAPMMTRDMKKLAKTDLYQGLAYLTDGFLSTDLAFLKDVVTEDDED